MLPSRAEFSVFLFLYFISFFLTAAAAAAAGDDRPCVAHESQEETKKDTFGQTRTTSDEVVVCFSRAQAKQSGRLISLLSFLSLNKCG